MELASQLVALLSPLAREELRPVCCANQGAALSAISDTTLLELERILARLIHFDRCMGRLYIGSDPLCDCLSDA